MKFLAKIANFHPIILLLLTFSTCFGQPPAWKEWDGKAYEKYIPQLDAYMLSVDSIYDDTKELNWAAKIFTIMSFKTNTPGFNGKVNFEHPPSLFEIATAEHKVNNDFNLKKNIRKTCVENTRTIHTTIKRNALQRVDLGEFSEENLKKNCPSLHAVCSDRDRGNAWMHYDTFKHCASNWRVPLRMDRYFELYATSMPRGVPLAFMQCNSVGALPLFTLVQSNPQVDRLLEVIANDKTHIFRFYHLRTSCVDQDMVNETTVSFSIFPLIMATCKFKNSGALIESFLLMIANNSTTLDLIQTAPVFSVLLCLLDDQRTQSELEVYKLKKTEEELRKLFKTRDISGYFPYLNHLKLSKTKAPESKHNLCASLLNAMIYQTQLKPILWGRRPSQVPDFDAYTNSLILILKSLNKLRRSSDFFSQEKILQIHAAIFEYPELIREFSCYCQDSTSASIIMHYLANMTSPLQEDSKAQRAHDISWQYSIALLTCQMQKEMSHTQPKPVASSSSSSWTNWFGGNSTPPEQPKPVKSAKKSASPATNQLDAFLRTKDVQNRLGITTDDMVKISHHIVDTISDFPKEVSDDTIAEWLCRYARQQQPHTF